MINQPSNKSVIITRKVRLLIDVPSSNRDEISKYYKRLHDWQNIAFKAANLISSHLFIQEQTKELLYFQDDVNNKLVDRNIDVNGILNTSRQNSIYKIISAKFKNELPSRIMSCICQKIYSAYLKKQSDYFNGKCSIANYKSSIPVPIDSNYIYNLAYSLDKKNFTFSLFQDPKFIVPLKTVLGKDLSNNKVIIERIISGDYKLCTSSYLFKKKKLYFLFSIRIPEIVHELNPNIKVKASLSCFAPIIAVIKRKKNEIGDPDSFLKKREDIQMGLKRKYKAMKFNRGGHGRKQKISGIKEYKEKEQRFVDNYMHKISKELTDFCIANKAGLLELISINRNIKEARENPYILRNWSYYSLKKKIEYKCKMNGIRLILN